MTTVSPDELARLRIAPEQKARRKRGPLAWGWGVGMLLVAGLAAVVLGHKSENKPATPPTPVATTPTTPPKPGDTVLTVSGYVIPRERIEISPKFMGTVVWIGVKKGDKVKKGEVLVRLEDTEYRARLLEAQGQLALAEANLTNAEANLKRSLDLAAKNVDSAQAVDDARRVRDAAAAQATIANGQVALAQTYLDWCTIRAPLDGVVLEKLVDPNELVVPQSYGGTTGPSTALLAMADLNDLQVEIDLNEADTPRVHLNQRCRVSPEAYPDKTYGGYLAEIAPEANRQKGTLQVKVQIEKPDSFLTPELTAKVDFLAD